MSTRSIARGALVLVLFLVLAGCGGGVDDPGEEATGSTLPPTPQTTAVDGGGDFVADLDAVCLDLQTDLDALEAQLAPAGPVTDLAEASEVLGQSADAYDAAAAAAGELTPPRELQDRFDEFTGLLQEFATMSRQLADAAASGDEAALEELMQTGPEGSQDLAGVAGDLGLTCFTATATPPGAGVQDYCDQVTAYVEAVDAYLADPDAVDPGSLSAQGAALATASPELAADASADDRSALLDCARRASDAASALLDALGD